MNITLRAGEKLYINGAVIRVDRKVAIELMNDVTFLLESHVLQADEATTPLRQIYFAVQILMMDPIGAVSAKTLASSLIESAIAAFRTPEIINGLRDIRDAVTRGRHFDALKLLRALYANEAREMAQDVAANNSHAA